MSDSSNPNPLPIVSTDVGDLIARLAAHRTVGEAPHEELVWLASHGSIRHFAPGDQLAQYAEIRQSLSIVFSGHFAIYVDHGAGPHKVMEWGAGDVTGLVPYSRMSKAIGDIVIDEAGETFLVHRDHFPEMIRQCPTITTLLVHLMVDRARLFRSSELQDEKLLSLGRLSAGLAHELNNPASAAARSARLLADELATAETAARELGAARLSDHQLAVVDGARRVCFSAPPFALSPIERADREEMLAGWLEAHGADPATAASLTDTAVTTAALDELAEALHGPVLDAALRWVAAACVTRSLATDIERAATRISKLVGAMKNYLYMDRALVPEPVDLVASVNDTVALLAHKARKKSVGIDVRIEPDVSRVRAIGGDLNQVWMNLIDNAIDAVGESGRVSISAARRLDRIVVSVVDNGPGIAPEIRDRMFDPFVTSKPVGQGTGLGLDIARQLVRRNDGDIEVESQPGHTEFRVTLPAAADAAGERV
jgi:signal transduction histidine kinase